MSDSDNPKADEDVSSAATIGGENAVDPSSVEPRKLGRFVLGDELGRGGMGLVVEARDPVLRRSVALKQLLDPEEASRGTMRRFVAEAQLTSQLEHPNIVPVHELCVTPEGTFFVMKKVGGESLRQVLEKLAKGDDQATQHWTLHRLLTVFVQICHAVGYAHDRGIIHRDLKPANVMLGGFGEVLVMDWGLARKLGQPEDRPDSDEVDVVTVGKTRAGATLGTPGYMSPEQSEGRIAEMGVRSDIWSLGAILYEILTGHRAYSGRSPFETIFRVIREPPMDPRERAPQRHLDDEIAEVCLRALAREPGLRYGSAPELWQDVEAFLEGSRKRDEARRKLERAHELWHEYEHLREQESHLAHGIEVIEEEVVSWAPIDDPTKVALVAAREDREALGEQQARCFSQAVAAAERALSAAPDFHRARSFLADAYWARFEDAERMRDPRSAAFYADRALEYDDGRYGRLLSSAGALTLRTDPPDAEVVCERYEQKGLVWSLVDRCVLGRTPLEKVSLANGSYRLTIRIDGKRDTIYPVSITRGRHWDSGPTPLPLYSDDEIGSEFIYVPAGPAIIGMDPEASAQLESGERTVAGYSIGRHSVTSAEYADFLMGLHESDPEQAWTRTPRDEHGMRSDGLRFWPCLGEVGRYTFPLRDKDGDECAGDWPVYGVSWLDAVAYASWVSETRHPGARLVSEVEYEKAARGVDGRSFPWGDRFDPALCKMQQSRPGRPLPEPVGAFASDRSPYGVADLAGGIRAWCREETFDGDEARRPVRGGAWTIPGDRQCRAANRFGFEPSVVHTYIGVRLVKGLERGRGET